MARAGVGRDTRVDDVSVGNKYRRQVYNSEEVLEPQKGTKDTKGKNGVY